MATLKTLYCIASTAFVMYAAVYLLMLIRSRISPEPEPEEPKEPEMPKEPEAPVRAKRFVSAEDLKLYHEAIKKYIDKTTQQHEKKDAKPDPTTTDGLEPCPICHSKVNAEIEQGPGLCQLTITCNQCGLHFENSQEFHEYKTVYGGTHYVPTTLNPIVVYNRMAKESRKQPEIVRCKDCIYNKHRTEGPHILNWCGKFDNVMRDNDFCSFGEKPAYERRNDYATGREARTEEEIRASLSPEARRLFDKVLADMRKSEEEDHE